MRHRSGGGLIVTMSASVVRLGGYYLLTGTWPGLTSILFHFISFYSFYVKVKREKSRSSILSIFGLTKSFIDCKWRASKWK